ncbi:MAG: hypothetical protein J6U53_04625 [Tidjanibacter sp.]|nr:hypothetical protein [Tidjanibacter sp.]
MNKIYIAPSIEMESLQVEQGIAMSTLIINHQLFDDIYITEEDVVW